jgi:HAD superfamily hydrolase (TIGR01509 family)
MHRDIRAVAFDLDGLMFNTEALYEEVGRLMVERRGRQISYELLDQMRGLQARVALQQMIDWYGFTDTIEQLQDESDGLFAGILPTQLAPMPGLVALLRALAQAGIPKAITTSSRRRFVERVLAIHDYSEHFQFWLTAEDVAQGKPHPEIYLTAADRLGVAPGNLLVLEDSQNGCRSAVAAGACVVAVPGEHSRHHDFQGATLVAESLEDARVYELLSLVPGSPPPGTA